MHLKNGITLDTIHRRYVIMKIGYKIPREVILVGLYFHKEDRIDVLCDFRIEWRLRGL